MTLSDETQRYHDIQATLEAIQPNKRRLYPQVLKQLLSAGPQTLTELADAIAPRRQIPIRYTLNHLIALGLVQTVEGTHPLIYAAAW